MKQNWNCEQRKIFSGIKVRDVVEHSVKKRGRRQLLCIFVALLRGKVMMGLRVTYSERHCDPLFAIAKLLFVTGARKRSLRLCLASFY